MKRFFISLLGLDDLNNKIEHLQDQVTRLQSDVAGANGVASYALSVANATLAPLRQAAYTPASQANPNAQSSYSSAAGSYNSAMSSYNGAAGSVCQSTSTSAGTPASQATAT